MDVNIKDGQHVHFYCDTIQTVTINNYERSHYGPVPPQQEGLCLDDVQDVQIERPEKRPAKSREVVSSCQKRLSQLRQRICTWDDSTRPGLEFWQALYETCEDLERDLDKALL